MRSGSAVALCIALAAGGVRAQDAPPAAAEPAAAEMTEAELAELGLGVGPTLLDTSIRISGFVDFGTLIHTTRAARATQTHGWYVGNLNLYLTKNLSESLRTMAEIDGKAPGQPGYVLE